MSRSRVRWLLGVLAFAFACVGAPREGDAIFRLFHRWWYGGTYVYQPVCAPVAVQAQYVPQTCYRQQCSYVPVTTYRPVTTFDACTGCPVTAYRPVVVYRPQVTLVPYTSYRIVYSGVGCSAPAGSYGSVLYQPSAACCGPTSTYASGVPTDSYAPSAPSSTLPYDSGATAAPEPAQDDGTGPIPTYESETQPNSSGEQRLRPIPDEGSDQGAPNDGAEGEDKTQQNGTSGHPRLIDPESTTAHRPQVRPWSYSRVIWPARRPVPVHPAAANAPGERLPAGSGRAVSNVDDSGWRPSRR